MTIVESYEIDYDNLSYKVQRYFDKEGDSRFKKAIDDCKTILYKKHVLSDTDMNSKIWNISPKDIKTFVDFCTDNIKHDISDAHEYNVLLKKIITCLYNNEKSS